MNGSNIENGTDGEIEKGTDFSIGRQRRLGLVLPLVSFSSEL